mgnify:CR=1 FL=1
MIKHLFKYLLIVLLAGGFTACSEDEGAQILGGLYEKVDITPEPGMNLVGRVTDGKITRDAQLRLVRDGIVICEDSIASLKRFKDDAKEVAEGYECGITLAKFQDIKEGDVFECFKMEEYRD